MMLAGGRLGAVRLFSHRMIEYVTRDFTGDRPDEAMAGIPMHRGIGPHSRGTGGRIRGLGSIAAPATFGHGGGGTPHCSADPAPGGFVPLLDNFLQPDPWPTARLPPLRHLAPGRNGEVPRPR